MSIRSQSIIPGTCLIQRLSNLIHNSFKVSGTHIVLPTKRLHTILNREFVLKHQGTAFMPRLWTWDQFLTELTTNLSMNSNGKNKVMVSDQSEMIMEFVLKSKIQSHFKNSSSTRPLHTNSRHAHELVHLASELAKSNIGNRDARTRLLQFYEHDWHRTTAITQAITDRINDVFDILDEFQAKLSEYSWETSEKNRSKSVNQWLQLSQTEKQLTLPHGKIIIAGLTSLPALELKVFAELAQFSNIEIWLDEEPPTSNLSPIRSLRLASHLESTQADIAIWAKGVKKITSAPDIVHETVYVLRQIKTLLAQGIQPHDIAVIVPNEEAYSPIFKALAPTVGAAINIPLSSPWGTSQIGIWFKLLIEVGGSFEAQDLGQFLLHPYTHKLFRPTGTHNSQEFEHQLQISLQNLPSVDRDFTPLIEYFLQLKFSTNDLQYISAALQWSVLPLNFDPAQVGKVLEQFVIDLNESFGRHEFSEVSSLETLKKSINQVIELIPLRGFTANKWRNLLQDIYHNACKQPMRDVGEPLSGIQIISLTEARYLPLNVAFIVGCIEGFFPHGLPKDSLIDNNMRNILGLSGWNELEALEDTTFHLLTARLPYVELTYPTLIASTPTTRSRWIEQLSSKVTMEEVDYLDTYEYFKNLEQKTHLDKVFNITSFQLEKEGIVSTTDGLINTISASRLKNLIFCPYRYLLEQRQIKPIQMPNERDSRSIGNLLHKILETFFSRDEIPQMPESLHLDNFPLQLLSESSELTSWTHSRLIKLNEQIIPKKFARVPQIQHMIAIGWRKVAEFFTLIFEAGYLPPNIQTEYHLGSSSKRLASGIENCRPPSMIEIDTEMVEIHGSIDVFLLHKDKKHGILLDYKSSTHATSRAVGLGIEPQLVLYSYAIAHPPATLKSEEIQLNNIATAYFNLTDGKVDFVSAGDLAKLHLQEQNLISKRKKPSDLNLALSNLINNWNSRITTIKLESRFMADPTDCNFCEYEGICRKNDPRYRDRIESQKAIKDLVHQEEIEDPSEQQLESDES